MVVLDLTIEFRKYADHAKLVAAIFPSFDLVAGDTLNITVVFSGGMVHSDSLLIIASLINHLRSLSVTVKVPVVGGDTYASRIDFYKLINVPFEEQYPRKNSAGRFIELKMFDADTIYSLQDELNMILYQNRGIAKEVLELLFYCLGEIMDNTLVHSGLNSGWVSAQFYPRKEEIMLTICDYGQGIHRSLTTQPDTKYKDVSEPEALDLCIQRGVTNGKGLGFGCLLPRNLS